MIVFSVEHKVLESKHGGFQAIMLTEDRFNGIIFTYGRVSFDDADDETKLSFEYQIHESNGVEYDKGDLEHTLGVLLEELIVYGISKNDLVYSGGTDD